MHRTIQLTIDATVCARTLFLKFGIDIQMENYKNYLLSDYFTQEFKFKHSKSSWIERVDKLMNEILLQLELNLKWNFSEEVRLPRI